MLSLPDRGISAACYKAVAARMGYKSFAPIAGRFIVVMAFLIVDMITC